MAKIPNYKKMNAGKFLKAVGLDAHKWADAFMQISEDKLSELDTETMIGWFANSIMAALDNRDNTRQILIAKLQNCEKLKRNYHSLIYGGIFRHLMESGHHLQEKPISTNLTQKKI